MALLFLPVEGIPVAGYVRGMGGEPSVTTLLLVASAIVAFASGRKLYDSHQLETLAFFVLSGAAFLYPMSLGLTSFDPYALGYPERIRALLLALAPVAVFAWLRRKPLLLLAIVLALAAHRFRLLDSRNLWDYLLDPWITLVLAGFTIFARLSKSR
jgi:hypothetical protein